MEMVYDPATNLMFEIYQLLARTGQFQEDERARRDLFWQGMVHLREKNFGAALDCFNRSRSPVSEDGPVTYFIGRAKEAGAVPEAPASRLVRELTDEGHARLISMM